MLGFSEPEYARFAGTSLMLRIEIPEDRFEQYSAFGHYMSVYRDGISSAWQARCVGNQIYIGLAGTKSFYGDQEPHRDHVFAKDRCLRQLNMINEILPVFISLALKRNTRDQILTAEDLIQLEKAHIADRWVGTRAVAYDGFPTLGEVYSEQHKVINARCTTHLGSGGGSFSPASIFVSRSVLNRQGVPDKLTQDVLKYGSSNRGFGNS